MHILLFNFTHIFIFINTIIITPRGVVAERNLYFVRQVIQFDR